MAEFWVLRTLSLPAVSAPAWHFMFPLFIDRFLKSFLAQRSSSVFHSLRFHSISGSGIQMEPQIVPARKPSNYRKAGPVMLRLAPHNLNPEVSPNPPSHVLLPGVILRHVRITREYVPYMAQLLLRRGERVLCC